MPETDKRGGAQNEDLDPQDWEAFRKLAHSVLDDAVDYLRDVRERPVWQAMPEAQKEELRESMPLAPQGMDTTYRNFQKLVLPYPTGNIHPRFWGWVHGTGLASGLISELMSAAMNSNCGGRDHAALYVERQVIKWCCEIVQYPSDASGVLLSGTSMGNIVALTVARNAKAGCDVRNQGLADVPNKLVAYASTEVHNSIFKALELIGLGRSSLRRVPVNENFAIDLNALRQAIETDKKAGYQPFCVVGCAGTVNTGAIDDLTALAEICKSEGLWFHVDAAFGAHCGLSQSLGPRIRGIELSDSVAFDFHKWMYVQYDAGCVLVRNSELHKKAFAARPEYLQHSARGLAGGGEWFTDFGPELSRSFRALKVWFAFKTYGTSEFARMIEKNCHQADYLAKLVEEQPLLELLARPTLNIVCFRCYLADYQDEQLDRLNRSVVATLQERGVAAPSTTTIRGKIAIRVAITNHRSRADDFDLLVSSTVAIAREFLLLPTV